MIKAHPGGGHQVGVVAYEPGVLPIRGGAGFAGQIGAAQAHRAVAGAVAHHVLEHGAHDEGVARVYGLRRVLACDSGHGLGQHAAGLVFDAVDEIALAAVAAIGEHRVALHHLQRRHRAGAQRHGQVGRMLLGGEAETLDVLLGVIGAGGHQHPHGHQVFGLGQAAAHGDHAGEFAVVVLGFPALTVRAHHRQRRVVDHRGRRQAAFDAGGVDKGLEGGAGLAPGLGHMVEAAAVEVETAHQRADRAGAGVHGHEGALHFRHLHDFPIAFFMRADADDRTAADLLRGADLAAQGAAGEVQAVALDHRHLAAAHIGAHFRRAGGQDDGRQHVAAVAQFADGVVQRLGLLLAFGAGQFHCALWAAVAHFAVVIHQAGAQGVVRPFLVAAVQRGVNLEAFGVRRFAIALIHRLAHHFRHILRRLAAAVRALAGQLHRLRQGCVVLLLSDEVELAHPAQHVLLAQTGAVRVDDGVVGGRRLGQAGQHRHFRHGQVRQRLAVIGLRRGGEAVGALPQIDLVEVQLQDLILGQRVFDLEGQQRFVELAGKGFLAGQKEVLCHLHGDGAGAGTGVSGHQIANCRAHHANVINAAVLVETLVLCRHHRLLH